MYDGWRSRNIRYLSLKLAQKESVRSGPFDTFCNKKGWGIEVEKESWEIAVEKENDDHEKLLREIISDKKSSKSKKKRLELFKKGKRIILTKIKDWKETPDMEETKVAKIMKDNAMREKIVTNQKLRRMEDRESGRDLEEIKEQKESNSLVTAKVVGNVPEPQDPRVADLSCDNQLQTS